MLKLIKTLVLKNAAKLSIGSMVASIGNNMADVNVISSVFTNVKVKF